MVSPLSIPHRTADGLCPVNGIRDLIHWHTGRNWSNEFLWGLGQGGGFAYLRFKAAEPPRQVYWGVAGPRQHKYLADLFKADLTEIENRTFKFSWAKACKAVDMGTPPLLGPLDMFYLPFYEQLYHKRHIPIHYELIVGYEDEKVYVLDTGLEDIQVISLDDLEKAWNVNVPGLGKRNRLVIFDIPQHIPSTEKLIRNSIRDECQSMLNPPVSILGIPAMKKVAREIAHWSEELGEDIASRCLQQVREYLNSPPDLEGNHLTAGRDRYITFLEEAAEMVGWDFSAAIERLGESITAIAELADAILQSQLEKAAARFELIAEIETKAFLELEGIVKTGGHQKRNSI